MALLHRYVHQVVRLERMRQLHNERIWIDSDAPETVKDMDDPLFMLAMKLGFKPRMRLKGEFSTPDDDAAEPARTERALDLAFFWVTRSKYVCGCGKRSKHALGSYASQKLSLSTCSCCQTRERAGDSMERAPMWLDEAKGGRGTHYLSVQLGLQLLAGATSGFLEAHPWKMTEGGGLMLMVLLISTQFSSLVWCCANTASDSLKAAQVRSLTPPSPNSHGSLLSSHLAPSHHLIPLQAVTIYACELISCCLIFASGFVAETDLEMSLILAVRATDIMLWCAFVPMALLAYDNLIVPPFNMFIKSDAGTLETLYLMFIALLLLPVTVMQTLFGFGEGFSSLQGNAMEVVAAMDMVAGDVAATADEGAEAEAEEEAGEEAEEVGEEASPER